MTPVLISNHVPYKRVVQLGQEPNQIFGNESRELVGEKSNFIVRAFTAVELKNYNAILAPLIYQKHLAAVVVKQKNFADLLQCTSIDRCAL